MKIKYEAIDIFSGCGGVSCGLSLAGFKVKSAVEIEKHAVDTYLNYEPLSKVNVLNNDVCDLSGEQILKAARIKKMIFICLRDVRLVRIFRDKIRLIRIKQMKNERSYCLSFYVLLKKSCLLSF